MIIKIPWIKTDKGYSGLYSFKNKLIDFTTEEKLHHRESGHALVDVVEGEEVEIMEWHDDEHCGTCGDLILKRGFYKSIYIVNNDGELEINNLEEINNAIMQCGC